MGFKLKRRHYRMVEQKSAKLLRLLEGLVYPARGAKFPPVLINTLPKSGSVFIAKSISNILQVPRLGIISGGLDVPIVAQAEILRLKGGNVVCQEHLPALPHILAALERNVPRMVLHLRDPRQSLVSWAHHVNLLHRNGGAEGSLQGLEARPPENYFSQPVEEQLKWLVDHYLPKTANWIAGWMDAVDRPGQLSILITTFDELLADNRGLLERILTFHGIDFEADWIRLRPPVVGKRNYRTGGQEDWRRWYSPELLDRATTVIGERERKRFGWD